MNLSDTIIASATAVGEGGIAVVRISGPRSFDALKTFFKSTDHKADYKTHQLYHGIITDQSGHHVDEVMAVYMAPPRTYTRDPVVEIHCHGSQQVVKSILKLYLNYGLRLAQAGEFTYRAYVNGRLDLSQAEAVADLIHSKSESSRRLALSHVEGLLSKNIFSITDGLRKTQVLLEAWIDFPEEDLPEEDLLNITDQISTYIVKINDITKTYNTGRVLHEGASILLVGRPNVGKSSLLNSLLGEDRAIVTSIPGTTRDLLEEGATIAGVPVCLVDTAGLRRSEDPIEVEGVRRAKRKISLVDLVLFLVDGSQPVEEEDLFAYAACVDAPAFLVTTKLDLDQVADTSFCSWRNYAISVKTGQGLESLKSAIADFLLGEYAVNSESVMITEQRHYDALVSSRNNLESLLLAINSDAPLECMVFDLREALYHLGQISGETTPDSVLEGIFSKFCIGK